MCTWIHICFCSMWNFHCYHLSRFWHFPWHDFWCSVCYFPECLIHTSSLISSAEPEQYIRVVETLIMKIYAKNIVQIQTCKPKKYIWHACLCVCILCMLCIFKVVEIKRRRKCVYNNTLKNVAKRWRRLPLKALNYKSQGKNHQ